MKKKTFRLISVGGLGDGILFTPLFRALKEEFPGCRVIVYCIANGNRGHAELYRNNPNIDRVVIGSPLRTPLEYAFYYLKWRKYYEINYADLDITSRVYNKSAVEMVGEILDVTIRNKKVQICLTAQEEHRGKTLVQQYKNPIALHVTSLTSHNQNWAIENWEKLIDSMPGFTFLQVGMPYEPAVKGAVDLRGKTSIRDAFAVLKYVRCFAGVVSSMAHATNAFDTPGVVLYGPSSSLGWGHANNINIAKQVHCAPCVDILYNSPCPYKRECITTITVEEVRAALLRQFYRSAENVPRELLPSGPGADCEVVAL